MLYPLTFQPIFKERVWGGRNLAQLYGKALPPTVPIGESWEISDRPGDVSVVTNGPLAGKDLHWLVENHGPELLGKARLEADRFPLLVKILDAQDKLSLQVHPPASKTIAVGGDPKTEMWYIAAAEPGAELYVGLNPGVTKAAFEAKIQDGSVAECFHRVPVKAGDAMFLPSGRVHAIGAGLVIFEIQQNSDTTFRVFDWNRVGLDGKPRALHVPQSLASIDFNDFAPALVQSSFTGDSSVQRRPLVNDPLFTVEEWRMTRAAGASVKGGRLQILACLTGQVQVHFGAEHLELVPGQFCLLPASLKHAGVEAVAASTLLRTEAG